MPLATIWRDPKKVTDTQAATIRNVVHFAVEAVLKVKAEEVEVRVRDIGPLDLTQHEEERAMFYDYAKKSHVRELELWEVTWETWTYGQPFYDYAHKKP